MDWKGLGLNPPGMLFTMTVGSIAEGCGLLSDSTLLSKLRSAVPPVMEEAWSGIVTIALEDVRCGSETTSAGEEAINSTYIASYQQVTNPDYVHIHDRLQQAQQHLADIQATQCHESDTERFRGDASRGSRNIGVCDSE